jgi:hypothetical protein
VKDERWDNVQVRRLVRLMNKRLAHVSQTKDYEFSGATIKEHRGAGLEDPPAG